MKESEREGTSVNDGRQRGRLVEKRVKKRDCFVVASLYISNRHVHHIKYFIQPTLFHPPTAPSTHGHALIPILRLPHPQLSQQPAHPRWLRYIYENDFAYVNPHIFAQAPYQKGIIDNDIIWQINIVPERVRLDPQQKVTRNQSGPPSTDQFWSFFNGAVFSEHPAMSRHHTSAS